MDSQKNRLTETILLSTHNKGLEGQIRILEHAKRPLSRALPMYTYTITPCEGPHSFEPKAFHIFTCKGSLRYHE